MTTTDIIKGLAMDEKLREQLLRMLPFMEPADQYEISKIAWNTYMSLYNERLNENLQLQLNSAAEGKEKLGEDFYARAVKKTEKEMETMLKEGQEKHELSAARQAMQRIVNEINDAKLQDKKT